MTDLNSVIFTPLGNIIRLFCVLCFAAATVAPVIAIRHKRKSLYGVLSAVHFALNFFLLVTVLDGTYGVACFMPVYAAENDGETVSESCAYFAYRDGAFVETAENGFAELDAYDAGPFAFFAPGGFGACVSAQNLTVDGVQKNVEKYNILGSNYFKLRDIAMLLNGTPAQFSIGWDEASGVISITPGEPYAPVGGELTVGADKSASAIPSAQTVKIDGWTRSDLTVFNLEGNNFFKLRDLGAALGFLVGYDAETNTAVVSSRADGQG